ncbi:MAG: acyltransferase [Acidobacteriota bacterium]|nr:acyltransferase [Acidobacteriota bacterium]
MTEPRFPGSTQKELQASGRSARAKYRTLFIGRRGLGPLLKYELVNLFVLPVPGALGLVLRKIFLPGLLGRVGRGVVFGRAITLRHPHKIRIGDNAVIDDGAVLDAKGEANEGIRIGAGALIGRNTVLSCKEGSIVLGEKCNVSANCSLLSETSIEIGRGCFLAGGCYLVAGGNHPVKDASRPIMDQPSEAKGGIRIGDDVWLGAGVTVLDGVTIGRGTIVGAGAIVAASLPEYAYVVADRRLRISDRRSL